jgi:ATP-dependent DNA helicase RecG
MTLNSKDSVYFKKLHIESALELALIAPSRYEDRHLYNELHLDMLQIFKCEVLKFARAPKFVKVSLFAHNIDQEIEAIIFHPKPYHVSQFSVGKELMVQGKVSYKFGSLQMAQPKVIGNVGKTEVIYKTVVRNDTMQRLVRTYVTQEALVQLPEQVRHGLLTLHFPDDSATTVLNDHHLYALKFTELFNYLNKMQKKRRYFKSSAKLQGDITEWVNTLPFRLTREQMMAIADIEKDLAKETSARRMVVGDVGSGKTMVILASVLIASPSRSIVMAPTTLLADQLFSEAQKFLPDTLKIALVTNKTKKIVLEEYDLLIGTHALLYKELPKADLIMVDEQHRFGTAQRNMLTKLVNDDSESKPHFLQFSATPIPRTQAMIESSLIDVSLITTTPFEKDITTQVIMKEDFKWLLRHIEKEIEAKRQVLIIYPLVEESEAIDYQSLDEATEFWTNRYENVFVTHGKDKYKEEVLKQFDQEGNILLATTVVEVGISLSKLSTIVIVGAERLGLATLHQLRGRVSRNGLKGYCYLFTKGKQNERLDAFAQTTNGFEIANLDLKFRNSGDVVSGNVQSGKQFLWLNMGEDEKIVEEVKAFVEVKKV